MRVTRPASVAALFIAVSAAAGPYAVAAPVSDQDTMFTKAAHQGNLAEIAAGEDARANATSACVKEVGRVLVRDHGKLDADVRTLAAKLGVTLPGTPTAEQKAELAAVRAKAGTREYDAAWLKTQEAAHTKTLALIDTELNAGRNAEVKAAARAARPVVAMHLEMVRGGTCHAGEDARVVRAGSGGHLAARGTDVLATVGIASLVGGGILAGFGTAWLIRGRRRGNRAQ
ncbi:DUF4142 domain-containing protein [Streptomyces sp. NPDC058664]|uniref:DUF4142 domain-containing protein n=1 Tax=unclassified Streptomyces TaxID=2593676 RepID=UPI003659BA60